MILHLARTAFIALLLVGFAGSAQAALLAELSLNDCDSMGCEGSTLYLSVEDAVGYEDYGYTEGFIITYTINVENYTGEMDGFNQIGFKVIQDWTYAEVLTAPVGSITNDWPYENDVPWNPVYEAPINSNSLCDNTQGNTSKVCIAGFVDITDPLANGGSYEYTWTFYIADGTLMDTTEWHLGAQYASGRWRSAGHIISAQVPEPTAAVLFGLGAILVTRRARRR